MSIQATWIDHKSYNDFLSVEVARDSVSKDYQVTVAREVANAIPELQGKVGLSITHSHHLIKENEAIVGSVFNNRLYSKPKLRSEGLCPTIWVGEENRLVVTEGIENAPLEVVRAAMKVQELAKKIQPYLLVEPGKKHSKLGIALDPRTVCQTPDASCFIEKNNDRVSVLAPKQSESPEEKNILTYVSIDSNPTDVSECEAYCHSENGVHQYKVHLKL